MLVWWQTEQRTKAGIEWCRWISHSRGPSCSSSFKATEKSIFRLPMRLVDPGREPHPGHAQRRRKGSHFCGWPSTVNSPGMPLAMALNVPARSRRGSGGKITRLLSIEAAGAARAGCPRAGERLRTRPCPDHRTRARPRPTPVTIRPMQPRLTC